MFIDPKQLDYVAKTLLRNEYDKMITIHNMSKSKVDTYIANGFYIMYGTSIDDSDTIKFPIGHIDYGTRESDVYLLVVMNSDYTGITKVSVPDANGPIYYIAFVPENFYSDVEYKERVKYIYYILDHIVNDNTSSEKESIYRIYYNQLPKFIIAKELINRTNGELTYSEYAELTSDICAYDANYGKLLYNDVLEVVCRSSDSVVSDMFVVGSLYISETKSDSMNKLELGW